MNYFDYVLSEALMKSEPLVGGVTTNMLISLVSLTRTSSRSSVIGWDAWPCPLTRPWPGYNQISYAVKCPHPIAKSRVLTTFINHIPLLRHDTTRSTSCIVNTLADRIVPKTCWRHYSTCCKFTCTANFLEAAEYGLYDTSSMRDRTGVFVTPDLWTQKRIP